MTKICKICGLEIGENELVSLMTDASTFSQYYIHANPVICTKALRAEIARRDEIIRRLKEDGERLAKTFLKISDDEPEEACWVCIHCGRDDYGLSKIDHAPDCPIVLHRALMKEVEEK